METRVNVFSSAQNWLETSAVEQLHQTAQLPGVRYAVGFPDLHPGLGTPVGAAVVTERVLYPHLAGNDIGCGMALYQTELSSQRPNLERWVKKLRGLEHPWDGECTDRLETAGVALTNFDSDLGTIGGGNHFAELQAFDQIFDPKHVASLSIDSKCLMVLVHSGSRGLGESILRRHLANHGSVALEAGSEAATQYILAHNHAMIWARENRRLIADRFAERLGSQATPIVDNCHNSVTPTQWQSSSVWLHRKGAAAADVPALVIPGSRGTLSYLVVPTCIDQAAQSLAHGAGRKWARSDAKDRLRDRFSPECLTRTALGGRVICRDHDLIYEEAPQAYKDIGRVVADLVGSGLVRVLATLRPLITYKTGGGS